MNYEPNTCKFQAEPKIMYCIYMCVCILLSSRLPDMLHLMAMHACMHFILID